MTGFKQWAWHSIWRVHPGMERLLLWADGLPCPELGSHLARCAQCRRNAELLRAAVTAGREGKQVGSLATPLLHEIFNNLQAQMRAWCSLSGRQQHWMNALEFYFGKEMARQADKSAMAPATKALFHAFLGRKAADAVANQIASAAL